MKVIDKLNEMIESGFFYGNNEILYTLVNKGFVRLGYYTGTGKRTKANVHTVLSLESVIEMERGNDAPRGGVTGQYAKLIKLNTKAITAKYRDFKRFQDEQEALKVKKAEEAVSGRKAKAEEMKQLAISLGFKSVAEMKRANDDIIKFNNERINRYRAKQFEKFEEENGRPCDVLKIADRVRLSRVEVEFDCEAKKTLF